MGRSFTPKYRVEYRDNTMHAMSMDHTLTYDATARGKPDDARAEAMRRALNTSFNPGGCNFHASEAAGVVIHVTRLNIVRQSDSEIVGTASAPMFEVV